MVIRWDSVNGCSMDFAKSIDSRKLILEMEKEVKRNDRDRNKEALLPRVEELRID